MGERVSSQAAGGTALSWDRGQGCPHPGKEDGRGQGRWTGPAGENSPGASAQHTHKRMPGLRTAGHGAKGQGVTSGVSPRQDRVERMPHPARLRGQVGVHLQHGLDTTSQQQHRLPLHPIPTTKPDLILPSALQTLGVAQGSTLP